MASSVRLSVVVVTFNSAEVLPATLAALAQEIQEGDEVVVVDNASSDESLAIARRVVPEAIVIENGTNAGFPAACNQGAHAASGELLVFLNPDAVPQPGWGAAIRQPATRDRGWAAWQALITTDDGQKVNTAGNEVHFTGLAWAGQSGTAIDTADVTRREVPCLSGACFAVLTSAFRSVGGFADNFFLYHEDLDLSLRLRLAGHRIGLEPDARVDHRYEFDKGSHKWRFLERNRWAVIVRCWPTAVLVAALPALLFAEIGICIAALASGWMPQKARAMAGAARRLPAHWRDRQRIQRERRIDGEEFATWLTADLNSTFFGKAGQQPALRAGLRSYWYVMSRLIRLWDSRGSRKA